MNLTKLRKICEEATGGPWESHIHGDGKYFPRALLYPSIPTCVHSFHVLQPTGHEIGSSAYKSNKENSKYIATFDPILVSKMLDVVEAACEAQMYGQGKVDFDKALEALTKLTEHKDD